MVKLGDMVRLKHSTPDKSMTRLVSTREEFDGDGDYLPVIEAGMELELRIEYEGDPGTTRITESGVGVSNELFCLTHGDGILVVGFTVPRGVWSLDVEGEFPGSYKAISLVRRRTNPNLLDDWR